MGRHRFPGQLLHDRAGNIGIAAALSLPVLAMVVGGAIDVHHAETARSHLSQTLDAATLAAARDEDLELGRRMVDAQLGSHPGIASWASDFSIPGEGRTAGTASAQVKAFFLAIIGQPLITVTAEAEAMVEEAPSPPCVTLLDPSASQALLVNSGARLIARNCEIHVGSGGRNAAVFNAGSNLDVARVCVRSSSVLDNGGRPAKLETSCDAQGDPFADDLPPLPQGNCDHRLGAVDRGPLRLQPGVYCGGANFNGALNITFEPGLYVIRGGDWNVNGGVWSGEGVTFYFEDSSRIQFNSGIRAELSAPASGQYRNLLFFEKPGLARSAFIFNDSGGNRLDGIMYLPSRDMIYNSGSDTTGDRLAMVFNSLIINQATWTLGPVETAGGYRRLRLVR